MKDLFSFVRSVFRYWLLLVGGVGFVFLAFYQRIIGREAGKMLFFSIALICIICAFYKAWLKEYRALQVEKEKNSPKLFGQIERISCCPYERNRRGTLVALNVTIRSLGMDSIADNYSLAVVEPSGKRVEGNILLMEDDDEIVGHQGQQSLVFRGRNALYKRTSKVIVRGGKEFGDLLFLFEGTDYHTIYRDGSNIELRFADVLGKTYTAVFEIETTGGGITYLPEFDT